MTKSTEELSKERLARIEAAINLEEADRVPMRGLGGDIVASYGGITQYEFCYEYDKAIPAIEKFMKDFPFDWQYVSIPGLVGEMLSIAFAEFDDLAPSTIRVTGPVHDILGDKYVRFPGRELDENATPQFIGGTFMPPEEHDQLIEDHVKFFAEIILPRTCTNLETPRKAMAAWVRLGMEYERFSSVTRRIGSIASGLGFPSIPQGEAYAPLDIIGDFLRDVSNAVLDIRRYPDKVKEACEALVEPIVKYALSFKKRGAKLAFIPLHLNEYLSPKLYNEFYWPTLKKVILRLLEEDLKSFVFFEGYHDAHLETILELPKGWGIAYFEKTDVVKAKEILKGHTCIMGGIPISLLITGTPSSIDEYVKNLLEKVKPGGGFILEAGISALPTITPIENIHALIEAAEKYGKY